MEEGPACLLPAWLAPLLAFLLPPSFSSFQMEVEEKEEEEEKEEKAAEAEEKQKGSCNLRKISSSLEAPFLLQGF